MNVEKIFLKNLYPKLKYNPYIEITNIEPILGKTCNRVAIIVPGGGYDNISNREGDPIALEFLKMGYTTIKLVYSTDNVNHSINYPHQVLELLSTIDLAKKRYPESKIVLCGFSAGGHLAGIASYLYKQDSLIKMIGIGKNSKADALVLAYPVVTLVGKTHEGTKNVITGGNKSLNHLLSIDENVTSDFPKTFLWSTYSDELVPISNTISLDRALNDNNIKHKTIIYENGPHGLALANKLTVPLGVGDYNKDIANWINEAHKFLDEVLG